MKVLGLLLNFMQMLKLFLLFISIVFSQSLTHSADTFIGKLDAKLKNDFHHAQQTLDNLLDHQIEKSQSYDLNSLRSILIQKFRPIAYQIIYQNKLHKSSTNALNFVHAWKQLCAQVIPNWVNKNIFNQSSLSKRIDDDRFMKFVSIVGVVSLTITYLLTVSGLALVGLAGLAALL